MACVIRSAAFQWPVCLTEGHVTLHVQGTKRITVTFSVTALFGKQSYSQQHVSTLWVNKYWQSLQPALHLRGLVENGHVVNVSTNAPFPRSAKCLSNIQIPGKQSSINLRFKKAISFLINLIVILVPKLDCTHAILLIFLLAYLSHLSYFWAIWTSSMLILHMSLFFSFTFLYLSSSVFRLFTHNSGSHTFRLWGPLPKFTDISQTPANNLTLRLP